MNDTTLPLFGEGDTSFQAVGGVKGIAELVERFYQLMDSLPEAKALRAMHAEDLTVSKQKLAYFLSGWLGGPKLFTEHFGAISLPVAHSHLPVDELTKNSWLLCMEQALAQLQYPQDFRNYLMKKFQTPAESIRLMCAHKPGTSGTTLGVPAAVAESTP